MLEVQPTVVSSLYNENTTIKVSVLLLLFGFLLSACKVTTGADSYSLNSSSTDYRSIARMEAMQAGIDPILFERQINQESGFNPKALSPAGAEGIAQFMPTTALGLGIDPWNPIDALKGAARLMSAYVAKYGNYSMALAAYNAGSGSVAWAIQNCSYWLNCEPYETQNYIRSIMF